MADWTDNASETTEFFEKVALQNIKQVVPLQPKGACHNCDFKLEAEHLFCDADCRDDWEREQAAKRRNGR